MLKTAVLIVNYESADLTIACIQSILSNLNSVDTKIFVVDNNSQDGSVEVIGNAIANNQWIVNVYILHSCINGGFSYGNNICIHQCLLEYSPDYFILINPDAQIKPNAIHSLVDFMDAHPKAGIAGSRLLNSDGKLEASAHNFPTPLGELEGSARLGLISKLLSNFVVTPPLQNESHTCDWVSGAAMIIRHEVIKHIGLFDENYFLYFEEVDFCKRAKNIGWECWYVPSSVVIHLEGAATGIKNKARRRPKYWYDSRRLYFIKHHGLIGLILADICWSIGRASYVVRRVLGLGARGPHSDPTWFAMDLLWGDFLAVSGLRYLVKKSNPN